MKNLCKLFSLLLSYSHPAIVAEPCAALNQRDAGTVPLIGCSSFQAWLTLPPLCLHPFGLSRRPFQAATCSGASQPQLL